MTDQQVGERLDKIVENPEFEQWSHDTYAMVYHAALGVAGPVQAQTALALLRDCFEHFSNLPGAPPEFNEDRELILASLEETQERNSQQALTSEQIRRRITAKYRMGAIFESSPPPLPNGILQALNVAVQAMPVGATPVKFTLDEDGNLVEPQP